jgi:hypothetical protein
VRKIRKKHECDSIRTHTPHVQDHRYVRVNVSCVNWIFKGFFFYKTYMVKRRLCNFRLFFPESIHHPPPFPATPVGFCWFYVTFSDEFAIQLFSACFSLSISSSCVPLEDSLSARILCLSLARPEALFGNSASPSPLLSAAADLAVAAAADFFSS